jgi:hypothetical protein
VGTEGVLLGGPGYSSDLWTQLNPSLLGTANVKRGNSGQDESTRRPFLLKSQRPQAMLYAFGFHRANLFSLTILQLVPSGPVQF